MSDGGNEERSREADREKERGGRKGRRRWRFAAFFITFLVVVVLGLACALAWKLKSLGFQENVPIVQSAQPSAAITPPPDLQPAATGETEAPDNSVNINLAVGKTPIYAKAPIDGNITNILVIGLDSRKPGGNGRDDVNMVVSIDHKNKTIKLVSFLRDELVPIEGHDWNRLNSTYPYGGPGLTINTINDVYGLDVQRYVKLDFYAMQDIVDAVGGVDVILTDKEITYLRSYGFGVSRGAGVKHLDGKTALAYSRIREIDTDFQRAQRQRNVLTAALGKVRALGVSQAIDLMNKLLPEVKTNISTGEAIQLGSEVIGISKADMRQLSVPVSGSWSNSKYKGMLILSVDFNKNVQAIKNFLYSD